MLIIANKGGLRQFKLSTRDCHRVLALQAKNKWSTNLTCLIWVCFWWKAVYINIFLLIRDKVVTSSKWCRNNENLEVDFTVVSYIFCTFVKIFMDSTLIFYLWQIKIYWRFTNSTSNSCWHSFASVCVQILLYFLILKVWYTIRLWQFVIIIY